MPADGCDGAKALSFYSGLTVLIVFLQIMTRLAPLVGSDITERCLLPRYAIMCNDALFHVRKVSLHVLIVVLLVL